MNFPPDGIFGDAGLGSRDPNVLPANLISDSMHPLPALPLLRQQLFLRCRSRSSSLSQKEGATERELQTHDKFECEWHRVVIEATVFCFHRAAVPPAPSLRLRIRPRLENAFLATNLNVQSCQFVCAVAHMPSGVVVLEFVDKRIRPPLLLVGDRSFFWLLSRDNYRIFSTKHVGQDVVGVANLTSRPVSDGCISARANLGIP